MAMWYEVVKRDPKRFDNWLLIAKYKDLAFAFSRARREESALGVGNVRVVEVQEPEAINDE